MSGYGGRCIIATKYEFIAVRLINKSLMHLHSFALLLHAAVELPAALNFFCFPDDQLADAAPQAHAVIRQYAVLLLCSALIACTIASQEPGTTTSYVAGILAVYHVAPLLRAWSRLRDPEVPERRPWLKDPRIHFFVHFLCLSSLCLALKRSCWP